MNGLYFSLLFVVFVGTAAGQADRVIATIEIPVRDIECSHTVTVRQSDVLKQLALQPNGKLDPADEGEFGKALESVVAQKLLLQAARAEARYFGWSPAEDNIQREIQELVSLFPTPVEFEKRLRRVGFTSTRDHNFVSLIADRWLMEKYIDERFRRATRTTDEEERTYYDQIFVPDFRKIKPGLLTPAFEESKVHVRAAITELKVDAALKRYLELRKRMARITIHQ